MRFIVRAKITKSNSNQAELTVSNEKELSNILNNLSNQEAQVVIAEFSNMGVFTIGIGMPYGFVKYSQGDEPPYLVALADKNTLKSNPNDEVEFITGGTPTPIEKAYCLALEQVVEIMTHYFQNKELPQFVKWQEI